jgi:hypothetical protein
MYCVKLEATELYLHDILLKLIFLDAVFFANYIGDDQARETDLPSPIRGNFPASQRLYVGNITDWRCRSMRDAVRFAKSNNLLGLICQARLLVRRRILFWLI